MNPTTFIYWLHGFFEVSEANTLTPKQVSMIKEHLELALENTKNPYGDIKWGDSKDTQHSSCEDSLLVYPAKNRKLC